MSYYSQHAEELYRDYTSLNADELHGNWFDRLPEKPGLACDIGAASGRDANWLAGMGWDVIAVEPCGEFRELAQRMNNPSVSWLDDKLPELGSLRKLGDRFDLILVNAVWMHIPPRQRQRAFRIISELLAPGGLLVISIRHDTNPDTSVERGFHDTNPEELTELARSRTLTLVNRIRQADQSGRAGVEWETLCFQLSDDGTGNLPLLRHIIINDDKSSSYKLGLLRALMRIAEGTPGMVLQRTDDFVEIPFGLVGLYWLKLYIPLLHGHDFRQHGNAHLGYGFARDDFNALTTISPFDLRIGTRFIGEQARHVTGAIRDACNNIRRMPVQYTTYPGQDRQIFECDRLTVRKTGTIELNKQFLSSFGSFSIPASLWQTLGQYTCWLEPAIVNEWANLMMGWSVQYDDDAFYRALKWEEGRRDTTMVRTRAEILKEQGSRIVCTWSNADVTKRNYEIDHCFPWSHWFNNDLWNLMPASSRVNASKGNKLPSAAQVMDARPRILSWWDEAYQHNGLKRQFQLEAEASLPLLDDTENTLTDIFNAVMLQRKKLRHNQQLVEWTLHG